MKAKIRYTITSTVLVLLLILIVVLCAAAYNRTPGVISSEPEQTAVSDGYNNDSILYLDSSSLGEEGLSAVSDDNTTTAAVNDNKTSTAKETTTAMSVIEKTISKFRKEDKTETTTAAKSIDRKNKKYVFNLQKKIYFGFAALAVNGTKFEFDEPALIAEKLGLQLSNQKDSEYSYKSSDGKVILYSKVSKTDASLYITSTGTDRIQFQNGLCFGVDPHNANTILGESLYKMKDADGNDIYTYKTVEDSKTGDTVKYVAIFKSGKLIGMRIDLHDGEVK